MIDLLPGNDSTNIDEEFLKESLKQELSMALKALNERERLVLEAFYGINQPELTLKEIGEKYGMSRERARQVRERAIRRLRQSTQNKELKTYLGK